MHIRNTLLALLLGVAALVMSGCFSDSDNDDDTSNRSGNNQQASSLTALTVNQCNRTPEDEAPQTVDGLGFTGDPDSETQEPSSSTFTENCI